MFKRGKKEKKDKNKNASSLFSNLNTDGSSIEYGFDEKNPKSRATKWVIGGLLLGATITGIAVPWSLSSCTLNVDAPIKNNDIMYSYYDPIANSYTPVTYGQFVKRINNVQISNSIFDQYKDVFYISALKNLYDQEREAYLKFQAIYTKLHGKGPDVSSFGANLDKSFNDIEYEQRKILNDNKRNFQKAVNNSSSWYELWIKELQTNSIYGPQTANEGSTNASLLEKKAIYYMVVQQIKNSALARYQGAEIKTNSWDYTDYNFATNGISSTWNDNNDLDYKDNNGKSQKITKNDAQNIWKSYIDNQSNARVPYSPDSSNETNNKIVAVLETKSYCVDSRNPISQNNIDILSKYYKFALSSSIKLSTIKPGNNNSDPFSIDSEALKALFKINLGDNQNNQINNFIPISQISSFKGANSICNTSSDDPNKLLDPNFVQNMKDIALQKSIDNSDSQNLGSSKFIDLNTYLTTSSGDNGSSSTIDIQRLMALTSSDNGTNGSNDFNSIFSIKKENPIKIFMDLLWTITQSPNHEIDFSTYQDVKTVWDKLGNPAAIASNNLYNFVNYLFENIDKDSYLYKGLTEANDYNQKLDNRISSLASNDWNFLGNLLTSIFAANPNNDIYTDYVTNSVTSKIGYWSLYELSAPDANNNNVGTYLYVSTSGIQIFTKPFNDLSIDIVKKMAINDLIQTIDAPENSSITYYDVSSIFSKLNNDNLIIALILNNPDNVAQFKEKIKETIDNSSSSDSIETDPDVIYNKFVAQAVLSFNSEIAQNEFNVISSISSSLTTIVNEKRAYDFATWEDPNTGESIAILQTTANYGDNSVVKSIDEIDKYFMEFLIKKLEVNYLSLPPSTFLTKGGK